MTSAFAISFWLIVAIMTERGQLKYSTHQRVNASTGAVFQPFMPEIIRKMAV